MGRNWKRAQPQGPAPRQFLTRQTMFGNLKTKGFALEATHLPDPDKLCTLLALLAFAVALTVKTGVSIWNQARPCAGTARRASPPGASVRRSSRMRVPGTRASVSRCWRAAQRSAGSAAISLSLKIVAMEPPLEPDAGAIQL